MKNLFKLLLITSLLVSGNVFAQTYPNAPYSESPAYAGTGCFGCTTQSVSAALGVNSTTKGFLVPRHTAAQRGAIVLPATGLLVYQTDGGAGNIGFWYNSGTPGAPSWLRVGTGSGTVTGVTGTASRITSTGGATPAIDIAADYVGQNTITTVGTITTGTWNGTAIDLASYVTGNLSVSNLNSGTDADASHYWRGDGTWSTISAGVTLDGAYDFGGAGVGRTITASDGAVLVAGVDGFQVTGTFGSGDAIDLSGAGTRMFFNPAKAAFRSGEVDGTQWNAGSVGDYSFAGGYNSTASGSYSVAIGRSNTSSGNQGSASFGFQNTSSGSSCFSAGYNNTAGDNTSLAIGQDNVATGAQCVALGNSNIAVNASGAYAIGNDNNATGVSATAIGVAATASGNYSQAFGFASTASGSTSTSMGVSTTAYSYAETVVGKSNTVYTPASTSAWNAADRLFVIGNGDGSPSDAMIVYKSGQINTPDIPAYADDAAATGAGLVSGDWYRTTTGGSTFLKIVP